MAHIENTAVLFDLDQTLVDSSSADGLRARRRWREVYARLPGFRLYEGIRHVLDELERKAHPLAIVTSSPQSYAEKVIQRFEFKVDQLVAYHDTPRRKPHPDPLLLAAERLGVLPGSCIYVGDADIDARAANAAGMRSMTALWGRPDGSRLPGNLDTTHLSQPTELLDLIDPPSCLPR